MKVPANRKTWTEEIEVAGGQLVERVKRLLAEGNVRRLRIRGSDGAIILEIPLTVGAVAGGALAVASPALAVLGAFAALVASARVEVVRDKDTPPAKKTPAKKPKAKPKAKKSKTKAKK